MAGRVTEAIDSAVSRPASKKGNSRSKPIKSVTDSINDVSKKMKEGISTRNARKAIEKLGKTKVTVQLDGANRISDQIEQPKKKSLIQPSKLKNTNRKRDRDPDESLLPEDDAIDKTTKFVKVSSKKSDKQKRNLDSIEKETGDQKKKKDDLPSDDEPM